MRTEAASSGAGPSGWQEKLHKVSASARQSRIEPEPGAIMLTMKIYAQARETPDKTAIVFNSRTISYREFACLIEISRRYLAAQGLAGEGVAVLPSGSLMSTWILGLALHSLGMTTLAVSSAEEIGRLNLPDIRCVVATAGAHPGLDHICAAGGWRLLRVPAEIIDGATAQGVVLDLPDLSGPFGGHILLTSGTTGSYKKVFFDGAAVAPLLLPSRAARHHRPIACQRVEFRDVDERGILLRGKHLGCRRHGGDLSGAGVARRLPLAGDQPHLRNSALAGADIGGTGRRSAA